MLYKFQKKYIFQILIYWGKVVLELTSLFISGVLKLTIGEYNEANAGYLR